MDSPILFFLENQTLKKRDILSFSSSHKIILSLRIEQHLQNILILNKMENDRNYLIIKSCHNCKLF